MKINKVYSPVSLVYSNVEDCCLIMITTGVIGREGMLLVKFTLTTSCSIVPYVITRSH
jgi:hypothetical protein